MIIARRNLSFISLMIIFSLLITPFVQAAELSFFQKMKLKASEKIEQVQQRDWWITKAVSKAVSFVSGKAGGGIGAAVGYVIGAGLGGPVAAGMGAMIGFRIGDIVTKIFAKAVSEVVTQKKLKDGEKVTVKSVVSALKSVNKASLSAESVGAVLGDLIGGTMGAAAGIALLAGTGPIALPILGTLSAAYLGSKLGKAVFGGIFRWVGKKVLKKGYEAYAASGKEEELQTGEVTVETTENFDQPTIQPEAEIPATNPGSSNLSDISNVKAAYEKAYKEYTESVTNRLASESQRNEKLQAYREALEHYRARKAQLEGQN